MLAVRVPLRSFVDLNVRTGIALVLLFGLARALLVLQANVNGGYQVVSLVVVAMIALPWLVLTADGRTRIGLVRPARRRWIPPAMLAGAAAALIVYAVAASLWGHTISNPFAYIALSYSNVPASSTDVERLIHFGISRRSGCC